MEQWNTAKELLTSKADPIKAMHMMVLIGAFTTLSALAVFLIPTSYSASIASPLLHPILIAEFGIGLFSLPSAVGIFRKRRWGKILGQGCVLSLLAIAILSVWDICLGHPAGEANLGKTLFGGDAWIKWGFIRTFLGFSLMALVPLVFFGFGYLHRLPAIQPSFMVEPPSAGSLSAEIYGPSPFDPGSKYPVYRFSRMPIPMVSIFSVALFLLLSILGLELKRISLDWVFIIGISGVALIFIQQFFYLYLPSPFQARRKVVDSFGFSGLSLEPETKKNMEGRQESQGRLLIYSDGMEIRTDQDCYFLPYYSIYDLKKKVGFFMIEESPEVALKVNLPGVPPRLRLVSTNASKLYDGIFKYRSRFLDRKQESAYLPPPL